MNDKQPAWGFGLAPGKAGPRKPQPSDDWKPFLLSPPKVDYHVGGIQVVREDLCIMGTHGANGTKARAIWALSCAALKKGIKGVVSAGGRESTQSLMICQIARSLGLDFEYHCPRGKLTPILEIIEAAGFHLERHSPGYGTQCRCHGRKAAEEKGYLWIDTGVEGPDMPEIVKAAAEKVDFSKVNKLVVPVGSGMTLAGILRAVAEADVKPKRKVLGVMVGSKKAKKLLPKWGPKGWYDLCTLTEYEKSFSYQAPDHYKGAVCDPVYSGKCIEYLIEGDMFWNSGSRRIAMMEQ